MSYAEVFSVLALLAALGAGIAMLVWWVRRPISSRPENPGEPLPLFSHDKAALWARDDGDDIEEMATIIASRSQRTAASTAPSWGSVAVAAAPAASFTPSSYAPPTSRASAPAGGDAVHYAVPTDSTLQFLAGRLEITSGGDTGREIRFVRLPDGEPVEITFGRTDGPPYRHIQLQDGTVSRRHALMRLHEGRWSLRNLSATNPVVCNGRALGSAEERVLEEGDRIEMGEVVFRFRA